MGTLPILAIATRTMIVQGSVTRTLFVAPQPAGLDRGHNPPPDLGGAWRGNICVQKQLTAARPQPKGRSTVAGLMSVGPFAR